MSENVLIRRVLIGLLIASAVITLISVFLGTNRSDMPESTIAALKTLDIHVMNRQVVGGVDRNISADDPGVELLELIGCGDR